MKDLSHYQSLAQEMVRSDVERDRMLSAMDDMWHNRWSLPSSIADLRWIHKVVSTDPHDALRAGAWKHRVAHEGVVVVGRTHRPDGGSHD